MNYGIVTTWFERGAAYVSKQYMLALQGQGHNVFIYARGGEKFAKNDPEWDGDNVYWQKNNVFPIYNYVELSEFSKWVANENIEVVIFNEQIWFEPVIFCKKKCIKVGAYVDYYTEPMIECYNIYDFVICNTRRHLKAFSHHRCPIYCQWGTDINLFEANSRRLDDEKVRFFHSCGMNPHRKGTDLLIRAYIGLTSSEIVQSCLIIHSQVGVELLVSKLDSADRDTFYKLIDEKRIKLISQTVTAPGLYHLGDVYVYPSRLDGLGLTVTEAKSSGMPIIVPNDAPMNEFYTETYDRIVDVDRFFSRYDGYYWPQNEVEIGSLTKALSFYITNKNEIKNWSLAVRTEAEEKLDWMINASELSSRIADCQIDKLTEDVMKKCISFNERKFPFIYKFKRVYKTIFIIFNKIKSINHK